MCYIYSKLFFLPNPKILIFGHYLVFTFFVNIKNMLRTKLSPQKVQIQNQIMSCYVLLELRGFIA